MNTTSCAVPIPEVGTSTPVSSSVSSSRHNYKRKDHDASDTIELERDISILKKVLVVLDEKVDEMKALGVCPAIANLNQEKDTHLVFSGGVRQKLSMHQAGPKQLCLKERELNPNMSPHEVIAPPSPPPFPLSLPLSNLLSRPIPCNTIPFLFISLCDLHFPLYQVGKLDSRTS